VVKNNAFWLLILVIEQEQAAQLENGKLVLDSRLVSFNPDNGWKWICHLHSLQETTTSNEDECLHRFISSGRFLRRDERSSFTFLLRDGEWMRFTRSAI